MQSLGNIITSKDRQSSLMRGVVGALAVEECKKMLISIFGAIARDSCEVMPMKNKTLTVACLSSVLAEEIQTREKELVSNINKKLGGRDIERIKILS